MDIKKLEAWHQAHKRNLSFRLTKDPYHIWVSEIMLQQTQVDTVIPYFDRFIKKYPTVKDLAMIDEETLLLDVSGLGYYRRFKNMLKAAKVMNEQFKGTFPKTYEEVLSLPGVGKYTAGAIMSLAYNMPYSATDGNVIRVLSRHEGFFEDMRLEKNKRIVDRRNQEIIKDATPNIYTEAVMELGATLCSVRKPNCMMCPIKDSCFAFKHQQTDKLPYLSKLNEKKAFTYCVLIIKNNNQIVLRKRDESLLNGMYEYPMIEAEDISYVIDKIGDDLSVDHYRYLKAYTHVFTHQVWHMKVYELYGVKTLIKDWQWIQEEDQVNYPMAVAHKKIGI